MSRRTWRTEFGLNFGVPPMIDKAIAAGRIKDLSWHNDTCPSFTVPSHADRDSDQMVRLWIEELDPKVREFECRFTVCFPDGTAAWASNEESVPLAIQKLITASAEYDRNAINAAIQETANNIKQFINRMPERNRVKENAEKIREALRAKNGTMVFESNFVAERAAKVERWFYVKHWGKNLGGVGGAPQQTSAAILITDEETYVDVYIPLDETNRMDSLLEKIDKL